MRCTRPLTSHAHLLLGFGHLGLDAVHSLLRRLIALLLLLRQLGQQGSQLADAFGQRLEVS
jgi:hypothetical protein